MVKEVEYKKNLLVTLADKNYIQQAKQLFSSVYWNAGWDGDYMLLSHEIPEEDLKWFRDKGILIKECKPMPYKLMLVHNNPVALDKFYLFTPEFMKWENIVFLDSDMIVRSSLDRLTKIKGFGAVDTTRRLAHHFFVKEDMFGEIKKRYNMHTKSFTSGIFAFSTDIIRDDMLEKMTELFVRYENVIIYLEEGILNILFYNKWHKIKRVYNLFVTVLMENKIRCDKIQAIVLHFIKIMRHEEFKPWNPVNPFYDEWTSNYKKAEFIDLSKVQKAKKWKPYKIFLFSIFYDLLIFYCLHNEPVKKLIPHIRKAITYTFAFPGRIVGLIGILIKKISPRLYYKIKKHISKSSS